MKVETKVAVTALAITIGVQYLLFNTVNFNVLAAGIYLGVAKGYSEQVVRLYYLLALTFFFLNGLLVKGYYSEMGWGKGAFVALFGAAILAAVPIVIALITRKIRRV